MLLADPAHSPSILPAELPCAYVMGKSVEKLHEKGRNSTCNGLRDHNTIAECDNEVTHCLVDIDVEALAELHGDAGLRPVHFSGNHGFPQIQAAPYFLNLAPYESLWFLLEPA